MLNHQICIHTNEELIATAIIIIIPNAEFCRKQNIHFGRELSAITSHFSDIINEPVSSVSWSIIKGWLSGIVA